MATGLRDPRTRFFRSIAWLALAVAVVGFARTFFLPLARGTFQPLPATFLHAALLFGWVLLFLVQASLIGARAHVLHRRLGWLGLALAIGVAWSTIAIGVDAMRRDIAANLGDFATSNFVGTCTAMVGFLALVLAGVHFRRRSDVHRRLMLLATIAVLWPAWFRFRHYFPSVPFPEWVFAIIAADSLVLVAMWHDWRSTGRVHPVTAWVGMALIADHAIETLLFGGPGWTALGKWLGAALG